MFRQSLISEAEHAEKQRLIVEIIADGRINELDHEGVAAYNKAYVIHRQRDAALHCAINATYARETRQSVPL